MFFFGHLGITIGVVQSLNESREISQRDRVDLRMAAVMCLLPDLIDKPVGILYRNALGNNTRLWAHSLLFLFCVLIWLLVFRKSAFAAWVLWLCAMGHLLLDRIWITDMKTLLWPFLGIRDPLHRQILESWRDALAQPWTIFGEVIGLTVLFHLFFKFKLYKAQPRRRFLKTGFLETRR